MKQEKTMKQRKLWHALLMIGAVLGIGLLGHLLLASDRANAQPPFTTVITIDTTADLEADRSNYTCGFQIGSGALARPAPDGKCTLRRALIEASARPQSDRPIAIQFNIPLTDSGYSPVVAGTWVISVTEALPPLKTDTILNRNGQVTIDGSTQPGGRSDGPPIIIDTSDYSLILESSRNVIRHLAFNRGGAILVQSVAPTTTIEHIWMGLSDDGQSIDFRTPGQYNRMAFGAIRLASDGNVVRNSVLSGAFARAVDIDGGDHNLIENNWIGSRADGTVPTVDPAIRCKVVIENPDDPFAFYYDPNDWYGGWGIAVSGSGNIIRNNRLVGMNNVRSGNDTPAMALEVFGNNQQIISNTIGIDANGYELGVCGQAIKVSGYDIDVLDNTIAGASRFNPDDPNTAAILISDTSPLFDRITVMRNIVRDGILPSTRDYYEFGPGLPEALRLFRSARITEMNGVTVRGGNGIDILGNTHPCPNCLIDLYLDDDDAQNEALAWLGQTQADLNGNFVFTLTQPLSVTQGLHTISTSTADDVIVDYRAGLSAEASKLFLPMQRVVITGPVQAPVGSDVTFAVTVDSPYATAPFTYTYAATDVLSATRTTQSSGVLLTYRWPLSGSKTIDVLVENELGVVSSSHTVLVGDVTVTPTPSVTPEVTPTPSVTPTPGSFGDEATIYIPVVSR
jgi:hypothetical protein